MLRTQVRLLMFCVKYCTDRCALEYLQSDRSETKLKTKSYLRTEMPGFYWPFLRPLVDQDTLSPFAPALGLRLKIRLCHFIPVSMTVSMIPVMPIRVNAVVGIRGGEMVCRLTWTSSYSIYVVRYEYRVPLLAKIMNPHEFKSLTY